MTRNLLYGCLLLLLACGFAGSMTSDINIEVEHDPNADFGAWRSYAWLEAAAIPNDPEGRWQPPAFDADAETVRKRLTNSVEQMFARLPGSLFAPGANPAKR